MSWVKVSRRVLHLVKLLFIQESSQMNQLHWHVVDSQSFPLEVPGFTDLAQKGAYDTSSVYSPSDVADIVSFAGAVRCVHKLINIGLMDVL